MNDARAIRVLSIDDEDDDAVLMIRELRRAGFNVSFERVDTQEAMEIALKNHEPDLVICDYHMPLFTPAKALDILKIGGFDIPFIVASGAVGEEVAADLMRAGAHDFIRKDNLNRLGPAVHREIEDAEARREHTLALEKLGESRDRNAALVAAIPDMMFVMRADGTIEDFEPSESARPFLVESEFLGKTIEETLPPEVAGVSMTKIAEALRSQSVVSFEYQLSVDMEVRDYEARVVSSGADRVVSVVRDVTELKSVARNLTETISQLNISLEQTRSAQEQMIRQEKIYSLGLMASGIAHDLNNTLGPVVGYADLLLNNEHLLEDGEGLKRKLTIIRSAGKDAAEVIARMRQLYASHGSADQTDQVDLTSSIEQVVELTRPNWQSQAQTRGSNIEITLDYSQPLVVEAREHEVREVLLNLVVNAVDAMPSGGALTVSGRADDRYVEIVVADTGMGMSADVVERCLDMFYSTKGDNGTGLGLGVSNTIMKRHGGELLVESELGRGSTFTLRFPKSTNLQGLQEINESADSVPVKSQRILVADDETIARDLLTECLTSDGHAVTVAENGRQAYDLFVDVEVDVVITDWAMPDLNGVQLARAIKRQNPEMPIILLTGFGNLMDPETEKPPEVDVLVGKPLSTDKIREALLQVV